MEYVFRIRLRGYNHNKESFMRKGGKILSCARIRWPPPIFCNVKIKKKVGTIGLWANPVVTLLDRVLYDYALWVQFQSWISHHTYCIWIFSCRKDWISLLLRLIYLTYKSLRFKMKSNQQSACWPSTAFVKAECILWKLFNQFYRTTASTLNILCRNEER